MGRSVGELKITADENVRCPAAILVLNRRNCVEVHLKDFTVHRIHATDNAGVEGEPHVFPIRRRSGVRRQKHLLA